MILYHGTSAERAKVIFKEGQLKAKGVNVTHQGKDPLPPTEPGFLYLTNRLYLALYFATEHDENDTIKSCYIFKVNVSESILQPDPTEISMVLGKKIDGNDYRFQDSLNICCAVRTNKDLVIGEEVIEVSSFTYSIKEASPLLDLVEEATEKATSKKQPQPDVKGGALNWKLLS